ncbi:MAG: ZIP family metal transporter [Gemmatimonadota bacterium]
MLSLDPIIVVLLYASLAAVAAALGVVPHAVAGRLPLPMLGWANALASGLMLGVAYSLFALQFSAGVLDVASGALVGVAFVWLVHAGTGTTELDLNRLDELEPAYGYQVVLVNVLHSAYEGIAIGAAMLVSLPFGISMVGALAVHNIPEAMILTAVVTSRGVSHRQAAALAVAANLSQVLLAVVTFAVVGVLPALLPWVAGFAAGTLIYLVFVELLPESYREAGHTSIALVTLIAMGIVVALAAGGPS